MDSCNRVDFVEQVRSNAAYSLTDDILYYSTIRRWIRPSYMMMLGKKTCY